MDASDRLFDLWRRQVRIVRWLSSLVTEETKDLRPAPESWTALRHLADIQFVRWEWIREISPEAGAGLGMGIDPEGEEDWDRPAPLETVKSELAASERIVAGLLRSDAAGGSPFGPYPSASEFVQHMAFHDGWHAGLILLALRRGGVEPPEGGEMENVWGSFWVTPDALPVL